MRIVSINNKLSNDYRYGFQGQESDPEVKGEGNSVNYKFRMHDPRLGRFLSVDPLTKSYPHNTPYSFAQNRVIDGIDVEGLEWYYTASGELIGKYGESTEIKILDSEKLNKYPIEALSLALSKVPDAFDMLSITGDAWDLEILREVDASGGLVAYGKGRHHADFADKSLSGKLYYLRKKEWRGIMSEISKERMAPVKAMYEMGLGQQGSALLAGRQLMMNVGKIIKQTKKVNGITSLRKLVGWAEGKVAVIGRGQKDRVNKFAKGIGAETWSGFDASLTDAQNLINNKKWIQGLKDGGYTIYDVGTGPKSNKKGLYYGMEAAEVFGD